MRVLLVVSSNLWAGTERHVVALAKGLRQAGVDAQVVCPGGGPKFEEALRQSEIPLHHLPLSAKGLPRSIFGLARLAEDFDLLHSHLTTATIVAAGAGLVSHRPVLETRHFISLAYETRGWAGRLSGRVVRFVLARRIALNIAPSSAALSKIDGRAVTIPHGIPANTREGNPPGEGRFITVGRLDIDRNCDLLLRAFALARLRLPATADLTVVGDGTEATRLRALAEQIGVADRVHFTGWLDDPWGDAGPADVYLAAPFEPVPESFGLSVLEAMWAGLPVIAEPGGGIADLVIPGVTGLLVAPDATAWSGAMVALVSDPAAAEAMGAAGRIRAASEFSLDAMVRRTIEAYQSVLGHPRRRPDIQAATIAT